MTSFNATVNPMSLDSATIQVNRSVKPDIRLIGEEKTPIIVLDDFAEDLDEIRNYACGSAFKTVRRQESFYPGVRVPLPKQYVVDVVSPLNSLIQSVSKTAAS